jgi:hypothetical protein
VVVTSFLKGQLAPSKGLSLWILFKNSAVGVSTLSSASPLFQGLAHGSTSSFPPSFLFFFDSGCMTASIFDFPSISSFSKEAGKNL